MDKLKFLINDFPNHLKQLDASAPRAWGKMNLQQMIEHMTDSVREANGRIPRTIITPEEKLPAIKNFLMSDKEFRPETKNPLMPAEPLPVRNPDKDSAIRELEEELKYFADYYKSNPGAVITNAVFGHLNYEEWLQLLHKHAVHHLKQFGAM